MSDTKTTDGAPKLGVVTGSASSLPPPLWGIKSPQGHINHTTLAPLPDQAVEEFMLQEQTVTRLFRKTPCQSWEGYEAEGYSVVACDIVERVQNAEVSQRLPAEESKL